MSDENHRPNRWVHKKKKKLPPFQSVSLQTEQKNNAFVSLIASPLFLVLVSRREANRQRHFWRLVGDLEDGEHLELWWQWCIAPFCANTCHFFFFFSFVILGAFLPSRQ